MRATVAQFPDAERKCWHAHPLWLFDGKPVLVLSRSVERSGSDRDRHAKGSRRTRVLHSEKTLAKRVHGDTLAVQIS
jgi:hypothetical protein